MEFINDKVIVITGASRGIGRAICLELCRYNVKLAACSRNNDDLIALKNEVQNVSDIDMMISVCDISSSISVNEFISKVIAEYNKIDVLINNAGIGYFDSFDNLSEERWNQLFSTNVDGAFYLCKNVISYMKSNTVTPKGLILNVGSISHNHYVPGNAGYAASKAALNALSQYLFNEYRDDDILVTYLAVGSVNTSFSKRNPDLLGWKITSDDVAKIIINLIIMMYTCENACINYLEIKAKHPISIESKKE